MDALHKDNIVDLFVWVDDQILDIEKTAQTKKAMVGRPVSLTTSEIATIIIWNGVTEPHKTIKNIYRWVRREYIDYFPKLPAYQNFVNLLHNNLETVNRLLLSILNYSATLRFADSTILEVCKLPRMNRYKVAKGIAKMGVNHQGWHYGFKLHASIDKHNRLSGVHFTSANEYDAQEVEKIILGSTKILVGDSHYGASVMTKRLYKKYSIITIAPPHYRQRKKLMTNNQKKLLRMRTKIEAVFDYLKEHMYLVSSFPRSVKGYFVHYVRVLLGYQMRVLLGVS